MKRLFKNIARLINKSSKVYFKGNKTSNLIIYDDFFPNPVSGFRLDEFTFLLKNIPSSRVIIDSEKTYSYFGYSKESSSVHLNDFFTFNGNEIEIKRVSFVRKFNNINCKLLYLVFNNNLLRIYKYLEFHKVPYVITLYPGGGFIINDDQTDKALSDKLSSNLCKGVIVNQSFTKKYLIDKGICDEHKIKLIFGLPVSSDKLLYNLKLKQYYPCKKERLDICFVAARYSKMGMDKGYDIFIEAAKFLNKKYGFIYFHVIGGFNEMDIEPEELGNNIKFYGPVKSEDLGGLLSNFDIIVAPNRSDVISKGAFDGFPVGCCVEAFLVGCCVITTDPLKENQFYEENKEIFLVVPLVAQVVNRIENLIVNPELIKTTGEAGMIKTKMLYSVEAQLKERVNYLQGIISSI